MEKARNYDDDYDYKVAEDDDFDLEYIDLDEEDEIKYELVVLKQEIERETKLKEALLELMSQQKTLTFLRIGTWAKETWDKIKNIEKGLEEKAQIYEKDYISSKDGKKSIIEEYEKALEELAGEYKRLRNEKLNKIEDYEHAQHQAMNEKSKAISEKKKMQASKEYKQYLQDIKNLKKEIALAIEEDDDEKIATKREELRDLKRRNPTLQYDKEMKKADNTITEMDYKISETEKYLEKLDEAKNMMLNQIESDRDNALSGLVKQNFWQKLVGSIFNKFGKVKNTAGEQIKGLIAKMKEEGKKIREEYAEQKEKNAQVRAEKAQERAQVRTEKAQERAQAKAAKAEERRKQKQYILKSIDRRTAEAARQIETLRAQRAQYNGKNMTPVFEGGNGNSMPAQFDRE